MIKITEKAREKLKEMLGKKTKPGAMIRLFLNGIG